MYIFILLPDGAEVSTDITACIQADGSRNTALVIAAAQLPPFAHLNIRASSEPPNAKLLAF